MARISNELVNNVNPTPKIISDERRDQTIYICQWLWYSEMELVPLVLCSLCKLVGSNHNYFDLLGYPNVCTKRIKNSVVITLIYNHLM